LDTSCGILLVFRQQESIDHIKSILAAAGYATVEACTSGMQALRIAGLTKIDIAIVGFTLSDMPGMTFAGDLLSQYSCSVLMIAPPDQINYVRQGAQSGDILCLPRPISSQSLLTSLNLIMQYRDKFHYVAEETRKLKQDLDRRAVAEKAKTLLMNKLRMSESDAWRYIQKQSMNTGKPLAEIAENILTEYGGKKN
jgi:response regulator NasT